MVEEAGLTGNEALQKAIYSAGLAHDFYTIRALKELIRPQWLHAQIDKNAFWPPPKGNEVSGEIHIGDVVETGAPFGLNLWPEMVCHVLMAGSSGSGKTNTNLHVIRQLGERRIPFFIPDMKNDYASIGKLIGEENLLVTKPKGNELKLNPLEPPPGVDPTQWLQVMVDFFAQAFGLMVGSKGFLLDKLDRLYKDYHVYSGQKTYPSMFELYALLKKTSIPAYSRDARFLESALGRIKIVLITLGDVFDCSQGFPISELARTNWVLQLHGLAGFIQNFLILSVMCAIFMYRICDNIRGARLKHLIIMDEGKRIADRNLERGTEIPYTDLLISQVREFETGILLADQEVSKIAQSYKANTYTKIGFSQRNGIDILEMARCMSLNREQLDYFNKLQVGQAIVRFGRYDAPFVIQVPHVAM